jgi:hypothetical protein
VVVSNILQTSDAYRRGLRYGDEIVAFGGRSISTVNGFKNVLGIFPKGWRVPLSFRDDGQRRDVYVRLTGVHTRDELLEKTAGAPKVKPIPIPQPKERKGPDDDDRPREAPRPPAPVMPSPHAKKELPKQVADMIIERPGFANYHFNQQNRDRVWSAFLAHGDFAGLDQSWVLTGVDDGGGRVVIELGEGRVTGRFPSGAAEVDVTEDLAGQLQPAGSGGLLVALHVWQRMLRLGPEQFGQVIYVGTAPVMQRDGLYDVLAGTYDVIEANFLFDPDTGSLIGLELFTDEQVDPCEVYFGDYRDTDGRQVPHAMIVRHADRVFTSIRLESVQWSADQDKSDGGEEVREEL